MNNGPTEKEERPAVLNVPLFLIDDFPGHPFKVRLDCDMQQLMESIRQRGLISPVILRAKEDGRYEIVSGHRRKKACELLGLGSIRAEVRDLSRDEAVILMVESNLQRSEILPSEKALAYKMRLEAMKRQGQRNDLTSRPLGTKLRSDEELAESSPDSARQIQRYIRLNELIPKILDMVDAGKIALRPAIELSYLKRKEQEYLASSMEYWDTTPSHAQAIKLRALSQGGRLTANAMDKILREEKPNQIPRISIRYDDVKRYIPEEVPPGRAGEYVVKALMFYQKHRIKERAEEPER